LQSSYNVLSAFGAFETCPHRGGDFRSPRRSCFSKTTLAEIVAPCYSARSNQLNWNRCTPPMGVRCSWRRLDEPESWSQRLCKRCCVVSHNWKAAAPLGTVESKGADDGVPTDAKRSRKSENVGRPRSVVGRYCCKGRKSNHTENFAKADF
jgi:hypothetical protein